MSSSSSSRGAAPASASALRSPLVEALAAQIRDGLAAGKLDEDGVDRALTSPARAWVEGACDATAATPLADVESLVALIGAQLGGEAELAALADQIVAGWNAKPPIPTWQRAGAALVDGPGFVASQASEWLLTAPDWSYSGGRDGFSLEVRGLATASPALRALLGALVARLAAAASARPLDVRVHGVDGIDGEALVISGRAASPRVVDPAEESRLHRAALAG
ncbi:MAG: hypothetical protein R3F21_05150 [Myxococcota bacterium]